MKTRLLTLGAAMLLLASCSKNLDIAATPATDQPSATDPNPAVKNYVLYTIPQGQQFCDKSNYAAISTSELAFKVVFDSSAMYKTVDPLNQKDVNKLYGFSDSKAAHHVFSARFGWRWVNNALHLFAYTYNNSVLDLKEVGTVAIGTENNCSIKVAGETYIFTLNGVSVTMARASTTIMAEGYMLYPFFGGDENAPHAIKIWIK